MDEYRASNGRTNERTTKDGKANVRHERVGQTDRQAYIRMDRQNDKTFAAIAGRCKAVEKIAKNLKIFTKIFNKIKILR